MLVIILCVSGLGRGRCFREEALFGGHTASEDMESRSCSPGSYLEEVSAWLCIGSGCLHPGRVQAAPHLLHLFLPCKCPQESPGLTSETCSRGRVVAAHRMVQSYVSWRATAKEYRSSMASPKTSTRCSPFKTLKLKPSRSSVLVLRSSVPPW